MILIMQTILLPGAVMMMSVRENREIFRNIQTTVAAVGVGQCWQNPKSFPYTND